LIPLLRDIRRSGSAAVDLCDVAAGRLDGFYERGLHPWDLAAGDLIAREAGALTGGRPSQRPSRDLAIAAAPGVFEPLQALLEDFGAWHDYSPERAPRAARGLVLQLVAHRARR